MNDDFTQDSGVTESQGDYTAPQPQTDYSAPQPQCDSFGEQTGAQIGAYQQQTGSYQQTADSQNAYSQQNLYGYQDTNSYTNTNADANPYNSGNTYSNSYQQSTNQNLYYGQTAQDKEDSIGFGVASLVLGILSIFTFICCINYIFAILAIIFGIVQMVKSKKKGMAIAGIITAGISIILATIFWIAGIAGSEKILNSPEFDLQKEFIEESM